MLSSFFQYLYGIVVLLLVWQAIRVMSSGFFVNEHATQSRSKAGKANEDRTGQLTVHPELLDQEGRLTDEELLTVRFSRDLDPPKSAETSSE